MSSIGNGQLINLFEEKLLKKLKEKLIEFLHVTNVDNLLLKPCDPFYLGLL